MKAEIKGGMLIITLPCDEKASKTSSTGKSRIVATTSGNVQTNIEVAGKQVKIGVNAYIPVE